MIPIKDTNEVIRMSDEEQKDLVNINEDDNINNDVIGTGKQIKSTTDKNSDKGEAGINNDYIGYDEPFIESRNKKPVINDPNKKENDIQSKVEDDHKDKHKDEHENDHEKGPHEEDPHEKDPHEKGPHEKGEDEKDDHEKDDHEKAGHEKASHEKDDHKKASHEKANHEKASHEEAGHEKAGHEKAGHEKDGHEKDGHEKGNHEKDKDENEKENEKEKDDHKKDEHEYNYEHEHEHNNAQAHTHSHDHAHEGDERDKIEGRLKSRLIEVEKDEKHMDIELNNKSNYEERNVNRKNRIIIGEDGEKSLIEKGRDKNKNEVVAIKSKKSKDTHNGDKELTGNEESKGKYNKFKNGRRGKVGKVSVNVGVKNHEDYEREGEDYEDEDEYYTYLKARVINKQREERNEDYEMEEYNKFIKYNKKLTKNKEYLNPVEHYKKRARSRIYSIELNRERDKEVEFLGRNQKIITSRRLNIRDCNTGEKKMRNSQSVRQNDYRTIEHKIPNVKRNMNDFDITRVKNRGYQYWKNVVRRWHIPIKDEWKIIELEILKMRLQKDSKHRFNLIHISKLIK